MKRRSYKFNFFIFVIIPLLGIMFFWQYNYKSQRKILFPRVTLMISNHKIPEEGKEKCKILFDDRSSSLKLKSAIELRGSSSRNYPKRSFSIRIAKKNNNTIKWRGLNLNDDMVLYGPYADRSYIRNALSQELFRRMGHYSTHSLFVELYIGEDYWGLYELREKISLSSSRIEGVSHIFKMDKLSGVKNFRRSSILNYKAKIILHDSLPEKNSEAAYQSLYRFEKSLLQVEDSVEAQCEIRSFIDYFLLTELANSPDAYHSSTYFQVLENGKIRMGPVWDFDLAFGNSNVKNAVATEGWRFQNSQIAIPQGLIVPPWWGMLFKKPKFNDAIKKRWQYLRKGVFSDSSVDSLITSLVSDIVPLIPADQERWKVKQRNIPWAKKSEGSYEQELVFLKNWLKARATWMDKELID